jgi:hypothetical protein
MKRCRRSRENWNESWDGAEIMRIMMVGANGGNNNNKEAVAFMAEMLDTPKTVSDKREEI